MARGQHRRTRDVPHPTGERVRNPVEETNERRAKDLSKPSRPAICFLYKDLAELAELEAPAPVFGMYPASFLGEILPWLRCDRRLLVHVCSGALPRGEGIRVDVRPEAHPDILADGRHLPFAAASIDALLIDPPYTEHYARDLYGTEYPRPAHLLKEAARVVKPCGRIGFVHYITPNPPPCCHVVKVLGLSTGFGFPMRAVTIYEREQDLLGDV